jgi:hypothetical protein
MLRDKREGKDKERNGTMIYQIETLRNPEPEGQPKDERELRCYEASKVDYRVEYSSEQEKKDSGD